MSTKARFGGIVSASPASPSLADPTKFFGIELGAQSKYQEETERAIVNGAHTAQDLATILDKFVSLFVQCPTCRLPEIKWIVKKNDIDVDCAACGFNGRLPTNHKLVGYILKHRTAGKESKGAISVKDKRKLKQQQQQAAASRPQAGEGKAPASPKSGGGAQDGSAQGGSDDDDDWYTDTSSVAQEQRRLEELAEMRKQEEINDGLQKLLQQNKGAGAADAAQLPPVTVLKVFIATKERQAHEIADELKRLQLSRGFDDSAKIQILIEALVDGSETKTVAQQFRERAGVFCQLVQDSASAKTLMDRVEEFVGVTFPAVMPRTPMVLQALEDVLSPEVILEWAQSPPESSWLVRRDVALAVRKAAKVYTDWLAEQEGEDEGDEDEGDAEEADEE